MTNIGPKGESEMTKICVCWNFSKMMTFLPKILIFFDFNTPNIYNHALTFVREPSTNFF